MLHSVLLVEDEGAHIDALMDKPQLVVNGAPRREADLRDGDVFSIGRFEFAVHVPQPVESDSVEPATTDEDVEAEAEEIDELTAGELVERIEREQSLVEKYHDARYAGARALLQAASLKTSALNASSDEMSPEQLLAELRQLSVELDRRASNWPNVRPPVTSAATQLLKVHDRMAANVDTLADHMDESAGDPVFQRQAS